jgi:hypothetical protein
MIAAVRQELARWKTWWLIMWVCIFVALIALAFFLTFFQWGILVVVGFGVPEFIGARKQDDAYPPLTSVIVRYVDRELSFPLLFGLGGAIGSTWFGFPHPFRMGAFAAMLGWFNAHFDRRYENRR